MHQPKSVPQPMDLLAHPPPTGASSLPQSLPPSPSLPPTPLVPTKPWAKPRTPAHSRESSRNTHSAGSDKSQFSLPSFIDTHLSTSSIVRSSPAHSPNPSSSSSSSTSSTDRQSDSADSEERGAEDDDPKSDEQTLILNCFDPPPVPPKPQNYKPKSKRRKQPPANIKTSAKHHDISIPLKSPRRTHQYDLHLLEPSKSNDTNKADRTHSSVASDPSARDRHRPRLDNPATPTSNGAGAINQGQYSSPRTFPEQDHTVPTTASLRGRNIPVPPRSPDRPNSSYRSLPPDLAASITTEESTGNYIHSSIPETLRHHDIRLQEEEQELLKHHKLGLVMMMNQDYHSELKSVEDIVQSFVEEDLSTLDQYGRFQESRSFLALSYKTPARPVTRIMDTRKDRHHHHAYSDESDEISPIPSKASLTSAHSTVDDANPTSTTSSPIPTMSSPDSRAKVGSKSGSIGSFGSPEPRSDSRKVSEHKRVQKSPSIAERLRGRFNIKI